MKGDKPKSTTCCAPDCYWEQARIARAKDLPPQLGVHRLGVPFGSVAPARGPDSCLSTRPPARTYAPGGEDHRGVTRLWSDYRPCFHPNPLPRRRTTDTLLPVRLLIPA